jgi:hypothetical protein
MALYDAYAEALAPFVGQKIEKVNGDLLAKVSNALPMVPFFRYRNPSNHSLCYVVKESQSLADGNGCVYEEAYVYIGEMSNGVLTKLCNRPELRTDYDAEEIKQLRMRAEVAREQARNAEAALGSFGMFDN